MMFMEFKKIGDITIPVLGIGTWGMGGWLTRDTSADEQCIKAIRTAIELGMTHIDTAELYGLGHAEELVGEAIKDFNRKRLFITTKVWMNHLKYDDVIKAATCSLKRLGTDYIDLYLIHRPNPFIPLKETMKAMDFLVRENIIRYIGVSNFSVRQIKEAQLYTENKIVSNQIKYNILERSPEKDMLNYCQKNDIILTAYEPLECGKLAKPGFKTLDELCEKYKKTQAQIIINWLISKPNVITIPKSTTIRHIKENLGAIGWRLSKKDIEKLETFFSYYCRRNSLGRIFGRAKKVVAQIIFDIKAEKNLSTLY